MDDFIATYFGAWNETDAERRRDLLDRSVTSDVELIHPSGRYRGIDELGERIGRYQAAMPESEIVIASGLDGHNNVVRYAWRILDPDGQARMKGIDVAERADDGRLTRIVLFHGLLPPGADAPPAPPPAAPYP